MAQHVDALGQLRADTEPNPEGRASFAHVVPPSVVTNN
jgi:hypothetical protein